MWRPASKGLCKKNFTPLTSRGALATDTRGCGP